jgi:uncharacterized protein YdaT
MSTWLATAESKAEARYRTLVVDLVHALATHDREAAQTAMERAADIDAWFEVQGVTSNW